MTQSELTMTSPLASLTNNDSPLLGLTVIWHPEMARIGEQFIATDRTGVIELNRFMPTFQHAGKAGLPLGFGGISREPLHILRKADDSITIEPPASKMIVELQGQEIHQPHILTKQQLSNGVILGLGRSILLCLHWMYCLPKNNPIEGIIGVSSAAIKMRDQIRQIAATDLPVLLLGETGTGKEIAARALHQHSARKNKKLVSVNMAALNESLAAADLFGAQKGAYTGAQAMRQGLFLEAADSTLFLDEIGNTPATIQPMLLRVLETGDYRPLGATQDKVATARLITATDQDLYNANFNQALLRRLENAVIHLPPLRDRREDIGLLILHLLSTINSTQQSPLPALPTALVSSIANYDWPGNIRQLKHVLQRIMLSLQAGNVADFAALVAPVFTETKDALQSAQITQSTLGYKHNKKASIAINAPKFHRKKLQEITEQDVLQAMQNNRWTIQGAALELGISRPSMYKLIDEHSQIRRAEKIAPEEIRQTLASNAGDIDASAAVLKTPSEALRRVLKVIGMV